MNVPPSAALHPEVEAWFGRRYGTPTEVQARTWPLIASGVHVLATAPTGSGKTLAAFLVALDRLLTGQWETGRTRVLYLSPLKALNTDIQRNLAEPLAGLSAALRQSGLAPPAIAVATRSGDTPEAERRRMLRHPPEILATTPESLNLLLLSQAGRRMLEGVQLVILDEIHAVVDSRRGLHLMTAVERLSRLAAEPQRLALSATVAPLEDVAGFVGGYCRSGPVDNPSWQPRRVEIVDCRGEKRYELAVVSCLAGDLEDPRPEEERVAAAPPPNVGPADEDPFWEQLQDDLRRRIRANRTSLVFANSRRMAEKVTRLLNQDQDQLFAYSHHGSLSREVREVVETRFKAGELPAIVATSSLELGIDIGDLDEVLLLQSPPSIASTVQRLGRAGHQVGAVSRGRLYPTHGRDLLGAAVLAQAVAERAIEPVRLVGPALDVLAQVILAETLDQPVGISELYQRVRCCTAYHELPERHFELVLEMLAGRFADSRLRELAPRVMLDRVAGTVEARRGSRRLLAQCGGTIPDRGYFHLRLAGTRARLGELDEEFVWERSVGDAFTLGAQSWRIVEITHNDVLVAPGRADAPMAPFWKGEEQDRPAALSQRLSEALMRLDRWVEQYPVPPASGDPLVAEIVAAFGLERAAAVSLAGLVRRQRIATGTGLPHHQHLVIEEVRDPTDPAAPMRLLLHTGWGGAVNRPFALVLAEAWERRFGGSCRAIHDDDIVLVEAPHTLDQRELLSLVDPNDLEELLRARLPRTGYFGARFREIAQVAMLLPRGSAGRRIPLWLNRQRAKRLLEAVAREPEFPLTLETWRTSLAEGHDLERLRRHLQRVIAGEVRISWRMTSTPSPFASGVMWKQTNQRMYEDDAPDGRGAEVGSSLLDQLLLGGDARVEAGVVTELEAKLARTAPGWAPSWGSELAAWIEERVALDAQEWSALLAAVERDWGPAPEGHGQFLAQRVVKVEREGTPLRVATGLARRVADEVLEASLLGEWFATRVLVAPSTLESHFGAACAAALDELEDQVVEGPFLRGSPARWWVDRANLDRLVRAARRARAPRLDSRPIGHLPLFLACWTGLATVSSEDAPAFERTLERLAGFPVPAAAFETELLVARFPSYQPTWLDRVVGEGSWIWTGAGRRRLLVSRVEDLELVLDAESRDRDAELSAVIAAAGARGPELARTFGTSVAAVEARLWDGVWAGRLTNEDPGELRRAIACGFEAPKPEPERRPQAPGRRRSHGVVARWRANLGVGGRWLLLPREQEELDPLDALELDKDRARLVLGRYGVVFRELLVRELPSLSWGRLFRALRLLELAGEIQSGRFFDDLSGPQFALPAAIKLLSGGLPDDASWWCSALDPAAPSGLGIASLQAPRRLAGNAIAYRGAAAIGVLEGKRLELVPGPDDPDLAMAIAPLRARLGRSVAPEASVSITSINGVDATRSPYLAALAAFAEVSRTGRGIRLWRRWHERTSPPASS